MRLKWSNQFQLQRHAVTAITRHHLVWALSIRYIREQAALHITTYPLLELFTIVMLQSFLFTL